MDQTLFTFLFKAPPEVRIVELFGSWDNFSQPYQMHHDRRRGTGYWSGCFRFNNIIFDGDSAQWTRPRSGGLKQGGKYWFYFRLDDKVEAYDDSQLFTADCPLLPSQTVNVMEVPTELVEPPSRCQSAGADLAGTLIGLSSLQTLNPRDKFAPLNPPPVSKIHGRCVSDLALNGRLESGAPFSPHSVVSPLESLDSNHSRAVSPTRHPSKRLCVEIRASRDSQDSWRSAAQSSPHPSVYDAYDGRSCRSESEQLRSFPLPPARSSGAESALVDEYRFKFRMTQASADGEIYARNASPADADLDSTYHDAVEDVRPVRSQDEVRWPPKMYSVPKNEPRDPTPERGPMRQTQSYQASAAQEHGDVEFCSPTFSAATVSSGGLNTPFRLSAGYSGGATAVICHEQELEDVANRLQSLHTSEDASQPDDTGQILNGYAIPATGTESAQSLGKMSSTESSVSHVKHELRLPALLPEPAPLVSLADEILGELGYLGGSIG